MLSLSIFISPFFFFFLPPSPPPPPPPLLSLFFLFLPLLFRLFFFFFFFSRESSGSFICPVPPPPPLPLVRWSALTMKRPTVTFFLSALRDKCQKSNFFSRPGRSEVVVITKVLFFYK